MFILAALLTTLASCNTTQARVIDIDFNAGDMGYVSGFADYPHGEEDFFELQSGLRPLPAPLDSNQKGFMLSGNNHSDDLLMFLQGPIEELAEGGSYHAALCVEFASNAASGGIGIGGSPAESVYVKLGITERASEVQINNSGYARVSTDVGSQSQGGRDATVVGNIGIEPDDDGNAVWQIKKLCTPDAQLQVQSHEGKAWAWVGFDSGFEGTSTLYVTRLTVTLQ